MTRFSKAAFTLLFICAIAGGASGQTGTSPSGAPLRISTTDGAVNFNGITELSFPPGTVQISNRKATLRMGAAGGFGSVHSVGLSLPSIFTVSNSPVTGSGTLTAVFASQLANRFFAAPDGSSGTPTFRLMVPADVPGLDASKITGGTFPAARLPAMVASGASHAPGIVPDPPGSSGSAKYLREDATWAVPPDLNTGEANTASNVGAGGVGPYKQKTGVNLEFKNINAGSSKVTVTNDAGNSEIDVDVVEANIVHQNLSGAGSNTHAQIDTHLAATAAHGATGAVVGTTNSQTLTNKDLTSGTNTFPTLNQDTTGSAAKLTTARNIDGQSFDGTANITVIAPGTHAATSKATPVDADEVPLVDSAASNVLKRLTWLNVKATLKTYFDTLYYSVGGTDVAVADGGTGSSTAAGARTNLGLGNVANVDTTNASNISSGTLPNARIAAGTSCTLSLKFGGNSTGLTYTNQVCQYSQVGDVVFLDAYLLLSAKGSSTGNATLTGLPVAAASATGRFQTINVTVYGATYTGTSFGQTSTSATTTINVFVNNGGVAAFLTDANFANNSTVNVNAVYKVN